MLTLDIIAGCIIVFLLHCGHSTSQYIAESSAHIDEQYDRVNVTDLCVSNNSDCICGPETNEPIGTKTKRFQIECRYQHFTNDRFYVTTIPNRTEILILAWNKFSTVPKLSANKLTNLDLSNNQLKTITNSSFYHLKNLIELNLAWNQISVIEDDAFEGLSNLKSLDLQRNFLKILYVNTFKPLITLETLILSNNHFLNYTLQLENVDIYRTLGVPQSLVRLQLNDVGIDRINLVNGTGLKELYLKYNSLTKAPSNLPSGLELIDFSGNPFVEIKQDFLPLSTSLRELHMVKMTQLTFIGPHSFHNLTHLRVLNLNECPNLKTFSQYAFATQTNTTKFVAEHLERIILRNAQLTRLSFEDHFRQLKLDRIDLYGNPLICDCQLSWLRNLEFETYARCNEPEELRGRLVSELPRNLMVCRSWPNFVYTIFHVILILCILLLCVIPIWLLVIILQPSRRQKLQKIGSTSPYRQITIEPNLAEDYYL